MQKVQDRQNLFDIALQTAGGLEAALALSIKNGVGLTDDLKDGAELITTSAINTKVKQGYAVQEIQPATALTQENQDNFSPGGIGQMCVGVDFEIS